MTRESNPNKPLSHAHHHELRQRFEQLRAQKAATEFTGDKACEKAIEQKITELQVLWIKSLLNSQGTGLFMQATCDIVTSDSPAKAGSPLLT